MRKYFHQSYYQDYVQAEEDLILAYGSITSYIMCSGSPNRAISW